MPFSEEFLAMWEHIIEEVHKTEIPLECIKKVIIKLHGKKQKTINLQTLRRQGLDSDELETVLSRALHELGDQVRDIEFMVDVSAVAEIVQPETDKLLSNLK
jgi:acid phosphatase class B